MRRRPWTKEGKGLVRGEAVPGAVVVVEVVGLADAHRLVVVGHVVLGVGAMVSPAPVLVREALVRPELVAAETATVVVGAIAIVIATAVVLGAIVVPPDVHRLTAAPWPPR